MTMLKTFSAISACAASIAVMGMTAAPDAIAANKLFFEGDMVRGVPKGGPTGPVCVLTSQFKRGEKVVWRLRVFDPAKSKQLGKAGLKSLVVELPDGKQYKMHYRPHPPKKSTDMFWTAAWKIPANYPTGSFAYKVVATDSSGKVHTWKPFAVRGSEFTVIASKKK